MSSYGYTGSVQKLTIGTTGLYKITAYGAAGGSSGISFGGNGAEIGGYLSLTAGETIEIVVGGEGKTGTNGGAGGGGGTFVLGRPAGASSYSVLLVAGGGGGAASPSQFPSGSGGAGGRPTSAGTGAGGAGGTGTQGGNGGGGAGVKSPGGDGSYGGYGGGTGVGGYLGGGGGSNGTTIGGGHGGFGGGGGGGAAAAYGDGVVYGGGGGGGGYTGGSGGAGRYYAPSTTSTVPGFGASGGFGGTSFDAGTTFIKKQGVEMGNGLVTIVPNFVTCFATGTLIRTTRGDVAVERLQVGDRAITASGRTRPIRWIGHRTIDFSAHPRPGEAMPVHIRAHAFGEHLPARDLRLSPGHPVLVGADENGEGGHLVPIMCLINGTTVRRVAVDSVTYWHVELDAHDILLAEGLPAESYLDWGDRGFFAEGGDHALANPDFVVPGLARRCRAVALDGPVVEAERGRLDMVFATRLAAACRWAGVDATLDF